MCETGYFLLRVTLKESVKKNPTCSSLKTEASLVWAYMAKYISRLS